MGNKYKLYLFFIKTNILLIYIFFIDLIIFVKNNNNEKIIISLISDVKNIINTNKIINSIIKQGINEDLYKILMIIQINKSGNISKSSSIFQSIKKQENIELLFINESLTKISALSIPFKKYKNNPILVINDKCILPYGWLEMFIKDHIKYPNDAIVASIQFYFGINGTISEIKEGFNGIKFGIFNHVTEMIFNFALINSDLGGILYPKNFFKNSTFYDNSLFLQSSEKSEDFWQSAFIMIEDKILRQSSVIYDYTKYLLNITDYDNYYINKKNIYKKVKQTFSNNFPEFNRIIKKRQNKIVVSITSYPKRFPYFRAWFSFIKNQTYQINDIYLFLYKNDIKYFNYNISGIKIIPVDKDLKPHKKYFYSMKLYRDHAVIVLDDDIGYPENTFETFFNAYVDNPNIICGRRSHLILYENNQKLKSYMRWKHQQTEILSPDLNITLTNVGGSIFPPDILNINDELIPIINETITCDDLTLKYLSNRKGIPIKWVGNSKTMGGKSLIPKALDSPLFHINIKINDICLSKLIIPINRIILNNLCTSYKNLQTGNSIYLFDIHNKNIKNKQLNFEIYAFSFCPIDKEIKFNIFFDKYKALCFINELFNKENYIAKAFCSIDNCEKGINLDNYYFPFVSSDDNLIFKIYNYRKYLLIIFEEFICKNMNDCILKVILLDKINYGKYSIIINDKLYLCEIFNNNIFPNKYPSIIKFKCTFPSINEQNKNLYISGMPSKVNTKTINNDKETIPNQFIVSKIYIEILNESSKINLYGKLVEDLPSKNYSMNINLLFPKCTLQCNLQPYSHYVESNINCISNISINSDILFENQMVYLSENNKEQKLLIINQETLLKRKLNENLYYQTENFINKKYYNKINYLIINILLLLIIKIKKYKE